MNDENPPDEQTTEHEDTKKCAGPKVRRKFIVLLVLGIGLLLLDVFYITGPLGGSIKGFYYRTFHTPELVRNFAFLDLAYAWSPNEEREKFFEAYTQKKGFYGFRAKKETVDGHRLTIYYFTDDGRVTEIVDFTRDPIGPRNFSVRTPKKILLGFRELTGGFTEKTEDAHHKDLRLRFIHEEKE